MGVARKDDRHNEDLAREIADSFNKSMRSREPEQDEDADTDGGTGQGGERFVITGDQRTPPRKRRSR